MASSTTASENRRGRRTTAPVFQYHGEQAMKLCGALMRNGDVCQNVVPEDPNPKKRNPEAKKVERCGTNHPDRNAAVNAGNSFVLARSAGDVPVNSTFSAKAASASGAEPYSQRIAHILSCGTDNSGAEMVHGVRCSHATQPSNNCTVWFSWAGTMMTVWGLGSHRGGSGAGNAKYAMVWFDGTSKTWTRPA